MSRSSTSSSDSGSPWRFVARVVICGAPFLVLAGAVEATLFRTGESWSVSHVVDTELKLGSSLFSRGMLSQQFNLYKSAHLRIERPDIVALGSSRVMRMTGAMFSGTDLTFYNAGGLIQGVPDVEAFAVAVSSGELPCPRFALVGVDPWWLFGDEPARAFESSTVDDARRPSARVSALRSWVRGVPLPWHALREGAPGVSTDGTPNAIGIGALERARGFRRDGSRHMDPGPLNDLIATNRYKDREHPPVIVRIRKCIRQFQPNATIGTANVDRVIAAARLLEQSGCRVILYLPPFADEARDELDRSEAHREWWAAFCSTVPARFSAAGFPSEAPYSPRDVGVDDRWMLDGFHGGETLTALVLARVMQVNASRGSLPADPDDLVNLARDAHSPLALDGPRFDPR